MKNKKIKIFMSYRIDTNSEIIDNELFIPVRCGAIFDKRKDVSILGDNTGDNISKKRDSFCELTVLYWAWKNQDADYMGLCHYRRLISFNNKPNNATSIMERNNGCISIENLSKENINKYKLDKNTMQKEIKKYDAIFIEPIDLKKCGYSSNYAAMKNSPEYHDIKDMDLAIKIIKNKYPEMTDVTDEYMHKYQYSYLYNCFILKKELFNNLCTWLFDILFELETKINMETYNIQKYRTPGTIAERLIGIYILHLQKQKKYKISNKPLLFVEDTNIKEEILPAYTKNNVAIVSNFNNNYVPIFLTFLESFKATMDTSKNYDFIILISNISEHYKKLINDSIKKYKNISIRFKNPSKILGNIKKEIYHTCYSEDLYYRVVIPYLLPNYNKVVVVDVDTICKKDLAELFQTNIDNYLIAAVKDTVMQGYLNGMRKEFLPYLQNKLKIKKPYDYVNTGVLVLNCKKFRENYNKEFIINFIKENIPKVWIYEQDMINKLCDNNILFLDQAWNYYTQTSDFITKCILYSTLTVYQKHKKCSENAYLIHYAAHPKPWTNPDIELAEDWWYYARKTQCYEEILKRMCENAVNPKIEATNHHFSTALNDLEHWNKNVLSYWKYKLLRNITFGKSKEKIIEKKYAYKQKIWNAKNYKK